MTGVDTAAEYREWAAVLVHGSSPSYERLAQAVADDPATVRFLDGLTPTQRQPNLLFAALRWHVSTSSADSDADNTAARPSVSVTSPSCSPPSMLGRSVLLMSLPRIPSSPTTN